MKKILIMLSVLFVSACSSTPNTTEISAEQFGDQWPLTVPKGTLSCEAPTHIIFTTQEGQKYGVNGTASIDYPSILKITKDAENLGVKFKMSTNLLIEEGMKLCEK